MTSARASSASIPALVALLAVALIARSARADDGDDGDDDDGTASQVPIAVVVAGSDGTPLPPAIQATVQVSMERALERDPRLLVIDQDDRLALRARQVPKEAVAESLALLEAGETLLRRDQPKLALLKLQGASVQLARVLAWTSKQDLARAQYFLGAAEAMTGDKKGALATFVALLVWRPDALADPDLAPAITLPLWDQARAQLADSDRGTVVIESSPEGALAYVDGRLVGFTPTEVDGLAAGVHYVTIRREGFERRVDAVKVGARGPATLRVTLVPSERARDLAAARAVFAAGIESPAMATEARAALAQIADLIDVEQVVLVMPGKKDGRYSAAVYATDGGARLASLDIKVGARDLETAFADAAPRLYAQVPTQGGTRPRPRPRASAHRPIYKQWWFWGGVVTVAALAITIPIVASSDSSVPGCPADASCGDVLFRF